MEICQKIAGFIWDLVAMLLCLTQQTPEGRGKLLEVFHSQIQSFWLLLICKICKIRALPTRTFHYKQFRKVFRPFLQKSLNLWCSLKKTWVQQCYEIAVFKVHIFREGHKILRNLHLAFVYVVPVKSKVKILQNFVAFSKYMNFSRNFEKDLAIFCT